MDNNSGSNPLVTLSMSGFSHELNNILASISGSVYLAKKELEAHESLHLQNILNQCEQAADLLRRLRESAVSK